MEQVPNNTPPKQPSEYQQQVIQIPHWAEKRNQDKKLRILYEAEKLIATEGFQKADLARVAEKAAVSKATIYKIFKNKDELLLTIVRKNFQYLAQLGLTNLVSEGAPSERLYRTCYALADYLEQNKAFCTMLVKESGQLMEEIQKTYRAIIFDNAHVAEAFFTSMKLPTATPKVKTKDFLKILINFSIGIIYTWVLTGEGDLRKEADFYLKLFFSQTQLDDDSNKAF